MLLKIKKIFCRFCYIFVLLFTVELENMNFLSRVQVTRAYLHVRKILRPVIITSPSKKIKYNYYALFLRIVGERRKSHKELNNDSII
jgi:hypothetical protein